MDKNKIIIALKEKIINRRHIHRHNDINWEFPSVLRKPLNLTDNLDVTQLALCPDQTMCEKRKALCGVNGFFSPPRLVSSVLLLSIMNVSFLTSLSLNHLYSSCFYSIHSHLPSLSYMPLPTSLYATPTLPHLSTTIFPHMNGYKNGGKFIISKNKHVSNSVLLPCHIPEGCAMLWMGPVCSPHLGLVHTPPTHSKEHIHFPKFQKGHSEAVITSILHSFVIAFISLWANLALVLSCGFTAVRMGLRTQQQ